MPNWHLFYVLVQPPWRRARLIAQLRRRQIQASFHFGALHRSPLGRQLHRGGRLPHAEAAAGRLLRLPIHPRLTVAQQQRVIDALYEAFAARP